MGLEPTNLLMPVASGLLAGSGRVVFSQVKWGDLSVGLARICSSLAIWIAKWIAKFVF